MKIRVKKITLYFYPTKNSCTTNSDIELKIHIDESNENVFKWKKTDIPEKTSEIIYESLTNKSLALLNTRNDDSIIKEFCKIKVKHFEDEIPITNWKQYQIWCELERKRNEIMKQFEKAEKAVWKSGEKEIPDTNDYKDTLDQINEWIKNNPPVQYPPINQPIWIDPNYGDSTGNPPYQPPIITYGGSSTICNSTPNNAVNCANILLNKNLPDICYKSETNNIYNFIKDQYFEEKTDL